MKTAIFAATLAAAIFAIPGASLAADTLTIVNNGRVATLPYIGTPDYSRTCVIVRNWDDDVLARCREDGAVYRYDFDGSPEIDRDYNRIPSWSAGWYVTNQ
jgi:hypothetical protein